MSKTKRGTKDNPIEMDALKEILGAPVRDFKVVEASIKDEYCDYAYEQTSGIGVGRKHKVTGEYIVMVDMLNAFTRFNVHLATLDDAFKVSGILVDDINAFHNHEITMGYRVTGFKVKGIPDCETISFTGTKYSDTARGYFNITTPFIPIDSLSSYKWYNELKDATDAARQEVALYHEGKYRVNEDEEQEDEAGGKPKKRKARQLKITSPEGAAENPEQPDIIEDADPLGLGVDMSDFESARQ